MSLARYFVFPLGVKRALVYLWRHPRRTGFVIFNVIAVLLLFAWAQFTANMSTSCSATPAWR